MADGVAATQRFYSRWAALYDALARHAPGVGGLRSRTAAALAPAAGDVVVEMGCGTGANFPYLRDRVGPTGTVVGVDFTPGMLERARTRAAAWENVHVVRGDAARPPLARADCVVASFVVGMLADPAAAVDAWASLAGPGGRLALLDLAPSDRPAGRPLNALFRTFVRTTSPPGTRGRYASPASVLRTRVDDAHAALSNRCSEVTRDEYALGFARLAAGTVDA